MKCNADKVTSKAKYIKKKERTLFNDLQKVHHKLREIANWYKISNYNCNYTDTKKQMLYAQAVNNIYQELKNLLIATENWRIENNLKNIVVNDKCTDPKIKDLSELEQLLQVEQLLQIKEESTTFRNKKEFLEYIKEGKWFKNKGFICKFKQHGDLLVSLWLSNISSKGMCFEQQAGKDWDFKDGIFYDYSAGVYAFGSVEKDDTYIYGEDGTILESKMKDIILESYENKKYNLITKEELNLMWNKIENKDVDSLPILKTK